MSWLSKATGVHINLKPLAPIIGGAVGSIIPGVGTALGAGLGSFLSGVGNGQGVGQSIAQGAGSYLGARGAGGITGKLAPILSMAGGGGQPGQPGQGGGGVGGALSGVGDWLKGNGGKNVLGLAQGVNAAMLQKQSTDYAKRAMGSVQGSYDERAPLRKQGMANMLQPKIPNMGGLAAIAGANPYAPRPTATGAQPLVPVGGGY